LQTEVYFCFLDDHYDMWLNNSSYSKSFCEVVNRKCPARNTKVQLSTLCTEPERHNAQCHRQTDSIMPIADHTASSSMIG